MQRWNQRPRQWLLIRKWEDRRYSLQGHGFYIPSRIDTFFIRLVGGCVHTEFTVPIRFWLVIRLKFKGRKDLGLLCDVLAETGVESSPMKDVSMMPFSERNKTCECIIPDRISWLKFLRKRSNVQ